MTGMHSVCKSLCKSLHALYCYAWYTFFSSLVNSFVDMAEYLLSQGQDGLYFRIPKTHLKIILVSKGHTMKTSASSNVSTMLQLLEYKNVWLLTQ